MDAPQISTLREEETPPPQQPARTSKFRVKLLVNENTGGAGKKDVLEEEDGEDELEDEEDQLIDDEIPASDVSPSKGKLTPKKKKSARRKATGLLCV
jgi:hypothetical protein